MSRDEEERFAALMDEVLGHKTRRSIDLVFAFAGVAEEGIAGGDPQHGEAFIWLQPDPVLLAINNKTLWRHHVDELLERYEAHRREAPGKLRAAMALASDAELVAMLSQVSLRAPLRRQYTRLYQALFSRIFPGHEMAAAADELRGEVAALHREVKGAMTVQGRAEISLDRHRPDRGQLRLEL